MTEIVKTYSLEVKGTESINDLKAAITELTAKLDTLNKSSEEYKATLEKILELQNKLTDAMSDMSQSVEKTNDSFKEIDDNVKDLNKNVETVKETIGGIGGNSLEGLNNSITEVVDNISNIGGSITSDTVDAFFDGMAQGMEEAAKSAENLETNIKNIGGASSVKELKAEISDLRDRLVQLDKGSSEYKDTVKQLIDDQVKLKEVMNAGKNEMEAAEGSYNALSQRMSALKQVWKEATDEATRDEIGRQIAEINSQLKGMDASIGNFQRNVGNYKSALDGLDGSFVSLKTQLRQCKEEMQQLDPATKEYADAMARAAEITHQLSEQQEMIKYNSPDVGDQLSNIRGIATNLAAGYSALNAAMGLFGQENEEIQQAMLKVQQAMALVQGLQGLDGFIKRTKGLSAAMGLSTKTMKQATVATKANAMASKEDATAKVSETVATEGATLAQKGLNVAMKANPIGFIIGLIAALVAAYSLFKDKIMELIGANENLSKTLENIKVVLAGVGNAIKNYILTPVKVAVVEIKTLGKVVQDVFKGKFRQAAKDAKSGMTEMVGEVKKGLNLVQSYQEGANKKQLALEEEKRKKSAEERQKDLENEIKDNEAKYGSDFKYTEDGKRLYEELFSVRMAQYKEDSDEYREAQRDKWAYDREFEERVTKKNKEEEDKRNKASQDAAKIRKKIVEDNFNSTKKAFNDFTSKFKGYIDEYTKIIMDIDDTYNELFSRFVVSFKDGSKKIERNLSDLKTYIIDSMNISPEEAENFINGLKKAIANGATEIPVLIDGKKIMFTVTDQFIEGLEQAYPELKGKANEILNNISDEIKKANYNELVKVGLERIEKEFYNFDRRATSIIEKLDNEFEKNELTVGIDFPDEAIKHFENSYRIAMQTIYIETDEVEKEIANVKKLLTEDKDSPYFGLDEEKLCELLPEFQKLIDKRNELMGLEAQTEIDLINKVSEIRKKAYELQISGIENVYEHELNNAQFTYDQEYLLQQKKMAWYSGNDTINELKRQMEFQDAYYDKLIAQYQEEMTVYKEMSESKQLTDEQRQAALMKFQEMQFETERALQDKQRDKLKTSTQLIKEYVNTVKQAFNDVSDILSSIADSWMSLIELEKQEIETQLENGEISEAEANRREELNKESFEKVKALQVAQTIVNTIAGAIGAFLQASSTYPAPYGQIIGGVAAAATAAAGYAQVRQIQATQYGGGSSGSKSGSSTTFQLPNVMELEPTVGRNLTTQSNVDELNNGGGRDNTVVKAYVLESDINASQKLASKRSNEITF